MKKKLGLIVNPIAGMGGSVGLKGTDGEVILEKARELGAIPIAHERTIESLKEIISIREHIELITYPNGMGEDEARECGFNPVVIGSIDVERTSSTDTKNAAREMLKIGVDLLLFVGGDGTARDIYEVIGDKIPAVGVPSGVKIHSGVFAINPRTAGSLVVSYFQGKITAELAEVMDIDEEAFRQDRVSARLYGYLMVPHDRQMIQNVKVGSLASEYDTMEAIAWNVIDNMQDDSLYVIGPGTTTKTIMQKLQLNYTLLGVDVIRQKQLVALDVNEAHLLELLEGTKAKIVVTIIGGQGYVFGRGNQQISSKVIKKVGRENIIILATENKMTSLKGMPLLVDTGNNEINEMLKGYVRVITGYNKTAVYRIA